jgi:ubiquinone/menaquinone biosynthesis C-methylase UbiE
MNFDPVTSYYDQLARLVFGQTFLKAQTSHFDTITRDSKVLIVGGGTGWILEKLPENCDQITYIEPSVKMIRKAMQRSCPIPVKFIQEPIQNCQLDQVYDIIITNFFFDMFDDLHGFEIARMLYTSLKSNGIWIITEFEKGVNWWQRSMLYTMYLFFSLTTGIQVRKLPAWKEMMIKLGMEPKNTKSYFGKFISAISYQRLSLVCSTI